MCYTTEEMQQEQTKEDNVIDLKIDAVQLKEINIQE